MAGAKGGLFLGLDSSTQGIKATLIDSGLNVVGEEAVNFDRDLPGYGTQGGVHHHADGLTVTSPPLMWAEALDLLFDRMREKGCALGDVAAVSGSGQQHGSVWMKVGSRDILNALDPARNLREQLANTFSVGDSPVWMDASTQDQCDALEHELGGPQAVADLTGSRAYLRFTGNQIAKIAGTQPEAYGATERIALVSSFMASLLAGDYAPIDTSDGSGMNLMDLRGKQWASEALACTATGLAEKLGPVVPGHTAIGPIHTYFAAKYGFNPACLVIAWSGDNPNSLAGLRLRKPGDVAISLGTSDTMFGVTDDPRPSGVEGHVFANPVNPDAYMVMIVRLNGSLARERIRDACAGGSWKTYAEMLGDTWPGNDGNSGFYVFEPEITPPLKQTGVYRFDRHGAPLNDFPAAVEVRAILESQFLSLRLHAKGVGLLPASILATGGASVDQSVLRVMCDVFGVPVYVGEQTASAAVGAAYRALHGWMCREQGGFVPFAEVMAAAPPFRKAMDPNMESHEVYTKMLAAYGELEKRIAIA